MDIVDQLAEMMVKEYEEQGKRLSFELARLTAQVQTYDGMVRTLTHVPEMSEEKMADFLGVSVWFVKTSISRYKSGKTDAEPPAVAWEQILEMRGKDGPKSAWSDERRAYYEKDFSLRISEKTDMAEVFLADGNYSVDRISELTGMSVTSVERLKEILPYWDRLVNKP